MDIRSIANSVGHAGTKMVDCFHYSVDGVKANVKTAMSMPQRGAVEIDGLMKNLLMILLGFLILLAIVPEIETAATAYVGTGLFKTFLDIAVWAIPVAILVGLIITTVKDAMGKRD